MVDVLTRGQVAAIRLRYAAEIEAVTRAINAMGGDATIEDLIVLLIHQGWQPKKAARHD